MFSELARVLQPNGTLFIRMASTIGMEGIATHLSDPKTNRSGTYFLTRAKIGELARLHSLELIELVKTTNVQDLRAMTTLVMRKMS